MSALHNDNHRHLCNTEYSVLQGMSMKKAIKLHQQLIQAGYDPDKAKKLIKDVFKMDILHDNLEHNIESVQN